MYIFLLQKIFPGFILLLSIAVYGQNFNDLPDTFAIIGDFGLAGSNEASVANMVKSWNPEFIITTGDNNYPDGEASTIDPNIGQYYHNYISPYNGNYGNGADTNRFYPCLGNHDYFTQNAAPYLQFFVLPGNERYYDFIKGDIHFFAIDSDRRGPDGNTSTSVQGIWLKQKLSSSSSKWKIVYFHHSPYASDNVGSQTVMRWPFKSWGADIALSGHSHVYERVIIDDFPYIVNGVGGSSLSSFSSGSPVSGSQLRYNKTYGAQQVIVTPDTLWFKFYNKNNELIDNFLLTKHSPPATELNATITSPANNSSFESGSDITIHVAATEGAGPIEKVEFFADSVILGEDLSSPYSFTWNNVGAGNYALNARVTNSLNDTAVSGIVNIIVSPKISSPKTLELISAGTPWKYLDNGSNQGAIWTPLDFNDSLWKTGNTELGYGDGDEATLVSYGSSSSGKYITTYFRKSFELSDPSIFTALELGFVRDDGIAVYLNGEEVARNNLPASALYNTRASTFIDGINESIWTTAQISPSNLFSGKNVIAVEIHQQSPSSSDISFNLKLKAFYPDSITIPPPALTVSITSPANNSTFFGGSDILIKANASGGDGQIQNVEFFADSIKLGEDSFSPYDYLWTNPDTGTYILTAKASDSVNSELSEEVQINIFPQEISSDLIPENSSWKYQDNGIFPGNDWRIIAFNDSSWKTGNAELGYGDGDEATKVSFGSSSTNKYITTYFRKKFFVPDTSEISALELGIVRDDGVIVYLNGSEIYRNNMPSGSISNSTLASFAIDGSGESNYLFSIFDRSGLLQGTNIISVEIHQTKASSSDISFNLKLKSVPLQAPELISAGAEWKFSDDGSNQGSVWKNSSFNDSLWKTGNAELGYGDGGEATLIDYGTSSGNKYITTYFRKNFTLDDTSGIAALELNIVRDDGMVVYVNGTEILRNNLPSTAIFYNTLAPSFIDGSNESAWNTFTVSSASLIPGLNVIAVEIHQNSPSSSDISFNLSLKAIYSSSGKMHFSVPAITVISTNDSIYYSRGDFIIFPNPSNGLFTLEYCLDSLQENELLVEIYNPVGEVLYQKKLPVINTCVREIVELDENFLPGMYIMNVFADGRKESKRIILSR